MKAKLLAVMLLCFCVLGASVANAAMLCCLEKNSADSVPPCHKTIDDAAKDKIADTHNLCKSMNCFKAQTLPPLSVAIAINNSIDLTPVFQADEFSDSPAENAFQPPKNIS